VTAPASETDRTTALAALALGAVILGFAPALVRLSETQGAGPQAAAFWRFALSLPVLSLLAFCERRGRSAPTRSAMQPLALAAILFGLDLSFWHAAIVRTTMANATLLANLTPVIVAAAGWILFRERPTLRWMAGAATALAGAALLAGASVSAAPQRLAGDGLATLAAVWYALYMIAIQRAREHVGPFQASLAVTSGAMCVALAAVAVSGERLFGATPQGWMWLLLLGVVVHVGGQGAVVFALGRLPVTVSSVIILIQPIAAAIIGFVLFGEAFGPLDWVGAALVLCGIWLAHKAR
jgi:drug/metabolite transporter (DMT)-like permease